MNDLLFEIFRLRKSFGSRRQSCFDSQIDGLASVLATISGVKHPYALSVSELETFCNTTNIFSNGCSGWTAQPSSHGPYLYRLQSLSTFLRSIRWQAGSGIAKEDPDGAWIIFKNNVRSSGNDWLQLDSYGEDEYPVRTDRWWNCTWWTSLELKPDTILKARKIGMFSNWVLPRTVLLRCSLEFIESAELAHVPTVIDAYLQKIFEPVPESPVPLAGETIDLSGDDPCKGVDEYVIKPMPIGKIEFCPHNIDSVMRASEGRDYQENEASLEKLISYYKTL